MGSMAKPGRKTTTPPPPWAERIAIAREKAGLSQEALGDIIKRSQSSITGYETGKPEPSLAIYRDIANATHVSAAWLIFGEEGSREALSRIAAEADKNNRLFGWAFHQAARLFAEESVNADFPYTLAYTWKLLGVPDKSADEAQAKEAIRRTIEIDRGEFRKDIDEARKKRL